MKTKNLILSLLFVGALGIATAQEDTEMKAVSTDEIEEVASETTEKTYTLMYSDKVVKRSVKVETEMSVPVMLEDSDAGEINQDRVLPKKTIRKTVYIDNDEDDAFDEKIVFSYEADEESAYLLVSEGDYLRVALESGEELNIQESQKMSVEDLNPKTTSYVYEDQDGNEIKFLIEEYTTL